MHCVAFSFHSTEPLFPAATKIKWNNDPVLNTYFIDFDKAWNYKSDINTMRCNGLFLLIISRLFELQQINQTNPYILQMKEYIHKNYQQKITVQMIADHLKLNPVYCGALFSKETGNTILSYTNNLRITKAKELLNYSNDSVLEIAASVGIDDIYYFSRTFKKAVGLSPTQYRLKMN